MSDRDEEVIEAVLGRRVTSKGWVRGNCPWCTLNLGEEDKRQSLGLNLENGSWHCFRCQEAGVLQVVPEDLDVRRPTAKPKTESTIQLPEDFVALFDADLTLPDWLLEVPRTYLTNRGVSVVVGRATGCGVVFQGRHRNRVVVPVRGTSGELEGWSARQYVSGPGPKYLYPEGMDRSRALFNPLALASGSGPVFIVEGVFDALVLWPDAVACLGKPSPGQVDRIAEAARPVVTLLDGDAWRESEALAIKLRVLGRSAGSVRLGPRIDPATADLAAVRTAARASLDMGGAQVRV